MIFMTIIIFIGILTHQGHISKVNANGLLTLQIPPTMYPHYLCLAEMETNRLRLKVLSHSKSTQNIRAVAYNEKNMSRAQVHRKRSTLQNPMAMLSHSAPLKEQLMHHNVTLESNWNISGTEGKIRQLRASYAQLKTNHETIMKLKLQMQLKLINVVFIDSPWFSFLLSDCCSQLGNNLVSQTNVSPFTDQPVGEVIPGQHAWPKQSLVLPSMNWRHLKRWAHAKAGEKSPRGRRCRGGGVSQGGEAGRPPPQARPAHVSTRWWQLGKSPGGMGERARRRLWHWLMCFLKQSPSERVVPRRRQQCRWRVGWGQCLLLLVRNAGEWPRWRGGKRRRGEHLSKVGGSGRLWRGRGRRCQRGRPESQPEVFEIILQGLSCYVCR